MKTRTTYPEINGLNMKDARAALTMGLNTYDSLTPEGQEALRPRLNALENRINRLAKTEAQICRATLALSLKGGAR